MVRTLAITTGLCCLMLTAMPAEAKPFGRAPTIVAGTQAPLKRNVFVRAVDATKRGYVATKGFIYRHSGKIMATGVGTAIGGLGITLFGLGAQDPSVIQTGVTMIGAGGVTAGAMTYPVLDKVLNYAGSGR